ncbi:MAG: hypothetical protein JRI59_00680 [Deltaproteobacteria bacterium]|nr:hypothetical protein [Deltaproteobacteria bacterium]
MALVFTVAVFSLQACDRFIAGDQEKRLPEKVLKVVQAPKSKKRAEIVQRGPRQLVRVDGIAGPEYDEIAGLTFMVDGHHLAYEAKREGKWLLVLDGKEWPLEAEVVHGSIKVSPDYRRLALVGYYRGKWQAMVDGRPGPPFDFIWKETLGFSPDSKHVGYLALEGSRVAVVVDGRVRRRLEVLKQGKEALSDLLTPQTTATSEKGSNSEEKANP